MSKRSPARRTRRIFNSEFNAKVALAAPREDKTLAQLCQRYELHPNQISDLKRQLVSRASKFFDNGQAVVSVNLAPLHPKIRQQALELDFLNSVLSKAELLSAGK